MAANHELVFGDLNMTKADVKIGGIYYAYVGKNRLDVRVDAKDKKEGWWVCTNTRTGKSIRVSRLEPRGTEKPAKEPAVRSPRNGTAKVTTNDNLTIVENEPATVETIGGNSDSKPKAKTKKVAKSNEPTEKRLSALDAAFKVLSETSEPLNTIQLVEAMSTKGYWTSPGGKTPHATLYSAILRDLSKGDESRFVKTERGRFAANTQGKA